MYQLRPLVVEKRGRRLVVLAFTDLDGTVNNEGVSEKYRLATIAPARLAVQELQTRGIPVGIVTARSFGETLLYQRALGAEGFTIIEDGAVVILPRGGKAYENYLAKRYRIVSHDQETALILSKIELPTIKKFLGFISEQLKRKNLPADLIATCTSTPQLLKELVQYETVDDAKRAMDRLASAFVRNASEEQQVLINKNAGKWNIRVSGKTHHLHLIGKDADKGSAIQFINDNIKLFLPDINDVEGILPIVFGNDYNDLRLFEEAHSMGGMGVIVKDSRGYYKVPREKIAPYVIKTDGAYGYGMKEALETIFKNL